MMFEMRGEPWNQGCLQMRRTEIEIWHCCRRHELSLASTFCRVGRNESFSQDQIPPGFEPLNQINGQGERIGLNHHLSSLSDKAKAENHKVSWDHLQLFFYWFASVSFCHLQSSAIFTSILSCSTCHLRIAEVLISQQARTPGPLRTPQYSHHLAASALQSPSAASWLGPSRRIEGMIWKVEQEDSCPEWQAFHFSIHSKNSPIKLRRLIQWLNEKLRAAACQSGQALVQSDFEYRINRSARNIRRTSWQIKNQEIL
jgi:hypothetical protein